MEQQEQDRAQWQRWAQEMANALGVPAFTVTGPQGIRVQGFAPSRDDELNGWVILASAQPAR